ncbi:helix-turn-helix domain-containing protein [Actinoplanes sp. NPDC051411]|uniref:ArsR/SmtB family transcription factor n=1 Tax=Actinoplanes sp. NPDC051411 TaxID=3155522 RepID=UPI003415C429
MSLGDGEAAKKRTAALRAMAHPIRLRIMSLLTGAPLTAAEVARELGISHANASYHLRNLLTGGLIVSAGEEKIRGGIAKRYRYDAHREEGLGPVPHEQLRADFSAVAEELIRRVRIARVATEGKLLADAELWIDQETWRAIRTRVHEAIQDLHDAAQPPRTPGTIRTGTTVAMFEMLPPETEK